MTEFSRVVLYVGRTSSTCGACGKGADPHELRHSTILRYAPGDPGPGCGALFTDVASEYIGESAEQAVRALRPDLPFVGGLG